MTTVDAWSCEPRFRRGSVAVVFVKPQTSWNTLSSCFLTQYNVASYHSFLLVFIWFKQRYLNYIHKINKLYPTFIQSYGLVLSFFRYVVGMMPREGRVGFWTHIVIFQFFFFNKFLHFCFFLSTWGAECTLMRNKIYFFDFSKWLQWNKEWIM